MIENLHGIGIGFRQPIADALFKLDESPIRFVEVHPENYVTRGGRYVELLERAKVRWPIVTHGLSLCVGNPESFSTEYCRDLNGFLTETVKTPWHSEHLCFNGAHSTMLHDLVPLPFTKESIAQTCQRIDELQDRVGVPIAIENVSFYAHLLEPQMDEVSFLNECLDQSGASLLLDVNNVYVNAKNHGFDPCHYIDQIPLERVVQIHIAGHLVKEEGVIIDTHAEPICEDVFDLLAYTLRKAGPRPVLLERDGNYPDFSELLMEINRLDDIYQTAISKHKGVPP